MAPRTGQLILVRHGRTAGNGRQYVGWLDLPLDETGLAQAREAADALRAQPIDALHASSLRRARQTAEALQAGRPGLALQLHDGLREIDYGQHTGRDKDGLPLKLRHDHVDQPLPGGESLGDVQRRVAALLPTLLAPLARGGTVVVVAHFWSLRLLLGSLRGLDVRGMLATRDYKPDNASVVALPVQIDPLDGRPHAGPLVAWPPAGNGAEAEP